MLDLPTESTPRVANHGDRETAFTVDEADDPLLDAWPFLLIDRTGRILTVHAALSREGVTRTSTAGYSVFPANSQLHSTRCRVEGQSPSTLGRFLP